MTRNTATKQDDTPIDNSVDNSGERDYDGKIAQVAQALRDWQGPIVIIAHVDPDGDALGSTLGLKRALDSIGKDTILPMDVPKYLRFLTQEGEISPFLTTLPENTLLAVLDVADEARAEGAPLTGAAFTINVDHHGTNIRFGDLACVEPRRAATAHMVKDIIDAMGVTWTPEIATPCLTGILTDTGNLRFANTTAEVLHAVAELIEKGVPYAELTDRLQWRDPNYFRLLGRVMSTVDFPLDGKVATAHITLKMRQELGLSIEDSDDFVGHIRYAEGTHVAVFLKEREGSTKISVRSRAPVSAQAICLALGGGGHVVAAGATVQAGLEQTRERVLEAAKEELERHNLS